MFTSLIGLINKSRRFINEYTTLTKYMFSSRVLTYNLINTHSSNTLTRFRRPTSTVLLVRRMVTNFRLRGISNLATAFQYFYLSHNQYPSNRIPFNGRYSFHNVVSRSISNAQSSTIRINSSHFISNAFRSGGDTLHSYDSNSNVTNVGGAFSAKDHLNLVSTVFSEVNNIRLGTTFPT